ncbi:hypothetical protein OIU74_008318 [Salix koriyanagi]|uniref:Uncharacterized protein n=1 Tax=Salix koriyanagi TaxID=2511006 RepID=A0A9Q0Z7A3_9ROSI|nr:hypothetical protein OIU74_008318 [Salix koriyanagi]
MDDDTRRVLVQVPQKLNRPIPYYCVSGSYPDTDHGERYKWISQHAEKERMVLDIKVKLLGLWFRLLKHGSTDDLFLLNSCIILAYVPNITQLLESHGFLDYLERGIDYDGNNNNLLDKLQDTIGRGQNPISILPTAVAETEITTISDPYVGILGFPQTSGQKNKKRRGNKFLQQQEELVDTLSMLLGIRVFAKSMGFLRHFNLIFIVLA